MESRLRLLKATSRLIKPNTQALGWDAVAERLNRYLGDGWPAPPYSGDQVATLALCLEMAREGWAR